ncbi:MAG: hypothetical protein C4K48_10315 [Candidatus Thorarchaeota archaeon]|nr:MAG: hypothetical protein C4K48_10315 [Candidatus Thorarchaeota archaeon]
MALAIALIVVFGSLGCVVYFAASGNNQSDIVLMSIGVNNMRPDCVQILGIFEPFDEELRLQTLQCEPSVADLNPVYSETNESAYDTPFHATLTLDIYGDFVTGTAYQFTFRFLDEYSKVKTVYLAVDFTPDNASVQIEKETTVEEFRLASESFGNQQVFWTHLMWPESPGFSEVRATLLFPGISCYMYMANSSIEILGEEAAITKCHHLGQIFDDVIYPKAIEIAGDPDGHLGDIDGDPRVTVFLAPLVRNMGRAYLGFDDPKDEFLGPYSNRREMVYVDAEMDLNDTLCITTHEFNHLIWNNYEMDEADFLVEGLANLAVDLTGFWSHITDAVTTAFTYHPEVSLLHFNRFYSVYWDASYGQAYLFVTYLAERFGVNTVKCLVSISEDGPAAVEIALADAGYDLTFNDVYLDFITACVLDDSEIEDGVYGFESLNYTTRRYTALGNNYPIMEENTIHYHYGFDVNKLTAPPDNFTIAIENPYPYAVGVVVAVRNSSGWHVSQFQLYSASGTLSEYIQSAEAEEVYVITSLISHVTPTDHEDVSSLAEIPTEGLDFTITEGDTRSPSISDSLVLPFSILIIVVFSSIFIVYRKQKRM